MIKITISAIFLFSCIFISPLIFAAENRGRIEELFLWKMSEDLKLNSGEEKLFSTYIRELNTRKTKANENIQKHLQKMGLVKVQSEREKVIKSYRKMLSDYNQLQLEEVDKISKILGSEKALQYFVFKNDIGNRLKELLARPEVKSEEKKQKPLPKLIEE